MAAARPGEYGRERRLRDHLTETLRTVASLTFAASMHKRLRKEIEEGDWPTVAEAIKDVASAREPARHPKVAPLDGSRTPNSHRLRVGRWRVTFTIFPHADRVVFLVGFLERRKEDYKQAVETHDRRVQDYDRLAAPTS